MRGLKPLFDAFIEPFGVMLPPWVGPLAVLGCVVLFWPWIRSNIRTSDARKVLKNAARERGEARLKLEADALGMVSGRPDGLIVVAETFIEQGRRDAAMLAVAELRKTKKRFTHLRRLERLLEPPLSSTAEEAAIVIERMIATGLVEEARGRLVRARKKWPFDEELEALEERMNAGAPSAG